MGTVTAPPTKEMQVVSLLLASLAFVSADFIGGSGSHVHDHQHDHETGLVRRGRQEDGGTVQGGVDFSGCQTDPETGLCCVEREEEVTSIEKEPILECTHKNTEQCHYTYVTKFAPSQEEVYVEKQPGKFVGDTGCEKLPVEICGAGCTFEEGPEECHDKTIASLVDVPEEVCDLNPQKTCRFVTKLVPRLKPTHQCTIVPQEVCQLKFNSPQQVKKPLLTKWCLDETPAAPGESYDEENALGEPLGASSNTFEDSLDVPASYGAARRRI